MLMTALLKAGEIDMAETMKTYVETTPLPPYTPENPLPALTWFCVQGSIIGSCCERGTSKCGTINISYAFWRELCVLWPHTKI